MLVVIPQTFDFFISYDTKQVKYDTMIMTFKVIQLNTTCTQRSITESYDKAFTHGQKLQ